MMLGKRGHQIKIVHRDKTKVLVVEKDDFTIGRSPDCDVVIDDETLSRKQVRVLIQDYLVEVTDLGSVNGSFVNRSRLVPQRSMSVRSSDDLWLGGTSIRIRIYPAEVPERSQHLAVEPSTRVIEPPVEAMTRVVSLKPEPPRSEPSLSYAPPSPALAPAYVPPIEQPRPREEKPHFDTSASEAKLKELERLISERETRLVALNAELETRQKQAHDAQVQVQATKDGLVRAEIESEEIRKRLDSRLIELTRTQAEVATLVQRAETLRYEVEESKKRRDFNETEARALLDQHQRALKEVEQIILKRGDLESRLIKTESELTSLTSALNEEKSRLEETKLATQQIISQCEATQKELVQAAEQRIAKMGSEMEAQISADRERILGQAKYEVSREREEFEGQRQTWISDFDQREKSALAAIEIERQAVIADANAKANQEFAERAKNFDIELATLRHKEMQRLDQVLESELSALKSKREQEIVSVLRCVDQTLRANIAIISTHSDASTAPSQDGTPPTDRLCDLLRTQVEATFKRLEDSPDGVVHETGATFNSNDFLSAKRAKKYWLRASLTAGAVTFMVGLWVKFPDVPGQLTSAIGRKIASSKSDDSGAFLQQIKDQRRPFTPQKDREFRDTYSENILYLEHYSEMKSDEIQQRLWILALNDFVIKTLGLNDRVIVELSGAETAMLNELISIREGMTDQFKDIGIKKLKAAEEAQIPRLVEIVGGEVNFSKLRKFEREFYLNYLTKRAEIPQ